MSLPRAPEPVPTAPTAASLARAWWLATAVVVLVGIVTQLIATGTSTGGFYPRNPQRLFNVFAYFTVQSNLLVGATSLVLALRPEPGGLLLRALRLDGVLGIAVTGVVFHLALRGLQDLQGTAALADLLLHTVSPVLGVGGWLLFGPRRGVDRQVIAYALVFPIAWLVFTLLRGSAVGFWPYPFVDIDDLGLGRVLLNCLLVAALFLALAVGAFRLDRALPGPERPVPDMTT